MENIKHNRSYLVFLFGLFLTQRAQNKLLIIKVYLPNRLIRLVNDRSITALAHLVCSSFIIFPSDFLPSRNFASVNFRISSCDLQALVWRNGQRHRANVGAGIIRIRHCLPWRIKRYPDLRIDSKSEGISSRDTFHVARIILRHAVEDECLLGTSFA